MRTIRVVAAIIRDGSRMLATQRGYGQYKDGWEFPGGKIEKGESSQDALKREIREELDLIIEVEELLTTVEYDYPEFHLSMECYWASIRGGQLKLKEHEAVKWMKGSELKSVDWLPADRLIIEKLVAQSR